MGRKWMLQQSGRHGLGLVNVKQRLELIYPGRHQLHIEESDTKYAIHLLINTQKSNNPGKS